MGWIGGTVTAIVGALIILGSLSLPVVACTSMSVAFLIDGVLCFAIAGAEFAEEDDIAKALSIVALIIFGGWALGFFFGPLSC